LINLLSHVFLERPDRPSSSL